jgi:hypothetical protein
MSRSRGQQVQFVADADVSTWPKPDSAKGQMALQFAAWLCEQRAAFSSEHTVAAQKSIFLGLLDVIWSITPALKVSLSTDLTRCTVTEKKAVQDIWHLACKE